MKWIVDFSVFVLVVKVGSFFEVFNDLGFFVVFISKYILCIEQEFGVWVLVCNVWGFRFISEGQVLYVWVDILFSQFNKVIVYVSVCWDVFRGMFKVSFIIGLGCNCIVFLVLEFFKLYFDVMV